MDGFIFTRIDDKEYRATLPGSLLRAAQKESVSVPMEPVRYGQHVNLTKTPWLNASKDNEKGLVGSIVYEKFDEHSVYLVVYCPKARTPYLFALEMP